MLPSPTSRLLTLALAILLVGCTGSTAVPAPSPSTTPPSAAVEVPEAEARVEDALVDAQVDWLLAVAAGAEPPLDDAAYADRFTDVFRDQVPLADLQAALDGLATTGPLEVTREVSRSPYGEVVLVTAAADSSEVVLTMTVDPDGRIGGLLVSPGAPPQLTEPVTDLAEVPDRLADLGRAGMVAGTVADGGCTPATALAAEEPAPVGSAAVLWVLGAVADAVEAGRLRWDTPLVLADGVRSLRSPVLSGRRSPSSLTVLEAAELAVEVSDHTAIDLLVRAVGRGEVEAAQARWGHATPALNTPFATTAELFRLKAADPSVQQRWVAGNAAARRAVLEDLADLPLPDAAPFEAGPVAPELGWQASPADLCRALVALLDAADRPELAPLADVLTTEPGVPDTDGRWSQVAFVGGGEPGLLSATWVVTGAAGRFGLAATLLDPAAGFDEVQAILLLGAARDLLGS